MKTGEPIYHFGEFTLDLARGALCKGKQEIKLRPKVYEALKYLVENPARLIGKQELIQAVWPDSFVTDDSLVQCTVELRRALGDRDHHLLKTVPRRGYIFTAPVTRSSAAAATIKSLPVENSESSVPKMIRRLSDLPTPRTSLIGRERETRHATELLLRRDVRLLSLTGAGGAGKTRLAIAVASAIAAKFPGGVQFVGLASISRPDLVASAIAKSLALQQAPSRNVEEAIRNYRAALQVRPAWEDGWWDLSMVYFGNARYSEAIEPLKRAVDLKPAFGTAWALLGLSEFEIKDYKNSLIHLERAQGLGIQGSPEAIRIAQYHLGVLLNQNGEFDRAVELLSMGHPEGPLATQWNLALGMGLLRVPLLPEQVGPAS